MVAKQEATDETKKRGDGPIIVTYVDEKAADNKRVVAGVTAVQIKDRKGNVKSYTLAAIPTEVQGQLIALAFAQRAKTYVNNQAKDDENADVIALTDRIFSDMIEGKVYSRTESEGGAPRGRVFDPSDYVEALKLTLAAQAKAGVVNKKTGQPVKEATEGQLKQIGTQLISLKGKERTVKIKSFMDNPIFKKHYLALMSKKIKVSADENEAIEDLF